MFTTLLPSDVTPYAGDKEAENQDKLLVRLLST